MYSLNQQVVIALTKQKVPPGYNQITQQR